MILELDDEQRAVQEAVRSFVSRDLEPFLKQFGDEPLPKSAVLQVLQMMRPFGVLSARLPEAAGGEGMDTLTLGIMYEELPVEVALEVTGNDVMALRLYQGGNTEIQERYLPGLIDGTLVAASGISEPGAGSDLTSIETRAERDGDEWVINGRKLWSSHAPIADIFLVACSFGTDERGRSQVGRILVDRNESEVGIRDLTMLGLRRHHLGELEFVNCRAPLGNRMGEAGDAVAALSASWLSQRPLLGMMAIGIARRALELSISYARERHQFGRPIGAMQLVQDNIVEMATLIDSARLLCYRALYRIDKGLPARAEASMAKAAATEAAVAATNLAVRVHGAMGLSTEYELERHLRDARMLTMNEGTTEINRLIVGRELLGLNAIR